MAEVHIAESELGSLILYCWTMNSNVRMERKTGFIEDHMTRCDNPTCAEVETPIAAVIG